MTRLQRVKYAFRFIRDRARVSAADMEATQSRFVAQTYGVEQSLHSFGTDGGCIVM